MATKRSAFWPILIGILALCITLVALPQSVRSGIPLFNGPRIHFGLDLAGGTQLDFRISEQEMIEERQRIVDEIATVDSSGASAERKAQLQRELTAIDQQRGNLLEAIRNVLERRINSLGVSEATITPSTIGSEKHLLVECPGVVDVQQCIATVGKTISLEFKEEYEENSAEYRAQVERTVAEAMRRMSESGSSLQQVAEDYGGTLGVTSLGVQTYYRDTLPTGLDDLWGKTPSVGVQRREATVTVGTQDDDGQPTTRQVPGIFLSEITQPLTESGRTVNEAPKAFSLLEKREKGAAYQLHEKTPLDAKVPARVIGTLRAMKPGELKTTTMEDGTSKILFLRSFTAGHEQVDASNILISYKGAADTGKSITRTKEEAAALIQSIKKESDKGAAFADLARKYSDGESAAQGGKITIRKDSELKSFAQAAFSQTPGTVGAPIETAFGFHLIRTEKAPYTTSDVASYDVLTLAGDAQGTRATDLLAELQNGKLKTTEQVMSLRSVFFSLLPTGWKDTSLDGKHFRSATVTVDSLTNIPVVEIAFDDEGGKIFEELTGRNIGKRIAIFVGGDLISAPTVQAKIAGGTAVITGSNNFEDAKLLAQELNTGAIPAPIFLAGQRTVEPTLGAGALQTSLQAALLGTILVMLFMIFFYRLLGVLADIALGVYAVLFFVLMKLPLFLFSSQYIVLTLAGMAGIILSIGMAVDANVLIFERIKEELRKGRAFSTAMETGFEKAWPSIRDGNVSTLITCAILFMVGTSIVRGFAITLGLGVCLSMFTAITVTKWMARKLARSPLSGNARLFGVKTTSSVAV